MTNGGPAFPVLHSIDGNWVPDPRDEYKGMTLRDYFAAAALPVLITAFSDEKLTPKEDGRRVTEELIAEQAYYFADAMIARRGKQ